MSTLQERKIHCHKQLFHINMMAIPFFYSIKPTSTLATQKVPMSMLQKYDCQVMQKILYKNNKSLMTQIITFQSIQKAQQCRQKIMKFFEGQNKIHFMCEFCKDISHLSGILFQGNSHYVSLPQTKEMKHLIDSVSQSVVMNGFQVEQKLKSLELKQLSFLNEQILSLQNEYYRWRVYSYMQADGDTKYRQEKFNMTVNGSEWYPPLLNSTSQYPSLLNTKQIKYFTEALEKMERRKYAIQQLMIFAIQNISHAVHIVSIIMVKLYELLMIEKQIGDIVSVLYLISDILFNSTNHLYRDLFQSQLPIMVYKYVLMRQQNPHDDGSKGTTTSNDKMFSEIKKLFSIWEKKFVFDQNFMKGLLFLLQFTDVQKLYKLADYGQHKKTRQIFGGQQVLYQLQKNCIENGLPYFQGKEEEAKLFLNALFYQNDAVTDAQPDLGKYDGEQISDKDLQKIQSKGIRVVCCQNLPISMVYEKNWKSHTSKGSLSQDGA